MQGVYVSYREMKRVIRDISAIDIQRFVRSFVARTKVKKSHAYLNANLNHHHSSSNNNSPATSLYANNHDSMVSSDDLNGKLRYSSSSSSSNNKTKTAANYNDLLNRYRELQSQKKDIKRQLKRFDEEFAITHGRQPKKADKEVMRPMYQSYHDVSYCFIGIARLPVGSLIFVHPCRLRPRSMI
jgi:hypothetical protein